MTRVGRFLQLSGHRRALLLEAALLLGSVQLAARVLDDARLTRWLGRQTSATPGPRSAEQLRLAEEVGWAIAAAARHLPSDPVCLPQALAARLMLRRRHVPSTLYLGVARTPGPIAHAWLRVGDLVVTGAEGVHRYVVVSTFA